MHSPALIDDGLPVTQAAQRLVSWAVHSNWIRGFAYASHVLANSATLRCRKR